MHGVEGVCVDFILTESGRSERNGDGDFLHSCCG